MESSKLLDLAASQCWKHIGIWGNESPRCEELDRLIHCRNCEVYSAAGRGLLERAIPEDYRDEWTAALALSKDTEGTARDSVLVFRLCDEWFGISTAAFREVIPVQPVRVLPHRTDSLLRGIVNVRGELMLCIRLEGLLDLVPSSHDEDDPAGPQAWPRMLILDTDERRWAFAVEEVDGIHRIDLNELREVPVTAAKDVSRHTRGIFARANRSIGYLDEELISYALQRRTRPV